MKIKKKKKSSSCSQWDRRWLNERKRQLYQWRSLSVICLFLALWETQHNLCVWFLNRMRVRWRAISEAADTHTHTHTQWESENRKERERKTVKNFVHFPNTFVNRFSPIYPTSLNVKQKVTERRRRIDERGSKEEESTRIF